MFTQFIAAVALGARTGKLLQLVAKLISFKPLYFHAKNVSLPFILLLRPRVGQNGYQAWIFLENLIVHILCSNGLPLSTLLSTGGLSINANYLHPSAPPMAREASYKSMQQIWIIIQF